MTTAPATSPDLSTPPDELRRIPLAQLVESAWNPRKHFDPARLQETADSLRVNGQLTPIVVRQMPNVRGLLHPTLYEIGAGHRRFRAAPLAGLTSLLAIVRPLDDVAFLELLNIENKQRDDLEPLDEAAGFKLLMEKARYDVTKLANRIGLSKEYVYGRLKLLQLIPELKKYLTEGVITAGHGVLLARLTPANQRRVMGNPGRMNRYSYSGGTGLFEAENADHDPDQPSLELKQPIKARSVRELATYINDHVRFRPAETDLPNLFPGTAAVLAEAKDDDLDPVYITYDHQLRHDAKDQKVRTYGVSSWRRADGTQRSKTCAWSRIGIVAAGRHRGDAFRVCVNRDRCTVHFAAARKAAKRQKTRVAEPTQARESAQDRARREAEAERAEVHNEQVDQQVRQLIKDRGAEWAAGINALAKQIKVPAAFATWMAQERVVDSGLENTLFGFDNGVTQYAELIFTALRPHLHGKWDSGVGIPRDGRAQLVGLAVWHWFATATGKLDAEVERDADAIVTAAEKAEAAKTKAAAAAKKPAKPKKRGK